MWPCGHVTLTINCRNKITSLVKLSYSHLFWRKNKFLSLNFWYIFQGQWFRIISPAVFMVWAYLGQNTVNEHKTMYYLNLALEILCIDLTLFVYLWISSFWIIKSLELSALLGGQLKICCELCTAKYAPDLFDNQSANDAKWFQTQNIKIWSLMALKELFSSRVSNLDSGYLQAE